MKVEDFLAWNCEGVEYYCVCPFCHQSVVNKRLDSHLDHQCNNDRPERRVKKGVIVSVIHQKLHRFTDLALHMIAFENDRFHANYLHSFQFFPINTKE